MKTALIVSGGWQGHKPQEVAEIFGNALSLNGFDVQNSDSTDIYTSPDLVSFDLIVPNWTMGSLTSEQSKNLVSAVRDAGCGLAGAHGGMGDSFRGDIDYQWLVGGQFLGHPHVGEYTVCRTGEQSHLTSHMPHAFSYNSEQYYMMVDPGVRILLDTVYSHDNQQCRMPVAWTRQTGKGRIFYSALGHDPIEYTTHPHVLEMMVRAFLWAARTP